MSLPLRAITSTHSTVTLIKKKVFSTSLRHCRPHTDIMPVYMHCSMAFSPWLYECGTHGIAEHVLLMRAVALWVAKHANTVLSGVFNV